MMGWVGSGHTKWTHGQLCSYAYSAGILQNNNALSRVHSARTDLN